MTVDPPTHRLPRHAVPHRYDLVVRPDLDAHTFAGTVAIAIEVHEAAEGLTLNAVGLDLHDARWTDDRGTHGCTVHHDAAHEQVRLVPEAPLAPGDGDHALPSKVLDAEAQGMAVHVAIQRPAVDVECP